MTANKEVEHYSGMRFQQEKISGQLTGYNAVVAPDSNSSPGMLSSSYKMKHSLNEDVLKRQLKTVIDTGMGLTESPNELCVGNQKTGLDKVCTR